MSDPLVKFKWLGEPGLGRWPVRATGGAACWDLHANENVTFTPDHTRRTIGTGIAVELPPRHVGLVCSRSGLAAKDGLFVLNAPGIIDEDYRGEIKVIMGYLPHSTQWPSYDPVMLVKGDRIAQLMVLPLPMLHTLRVEELSTTERGTSGLGSTGI